MRLLPLVFVPSLILAGCWPTAPSRVCVELPVCAPSPECVEDAPGQPPKSAGSVCGGGVGLCNGQGACCK